MYILFFKNVILSYIYIQTFTVNWKEKLFKCLNTFSNNAWKTSSILSSQMRSLASLAFRACSPSFPAPAYCMGPHPWCYHQKLSWPVSHLAPATPLSSICSLLPPVSPSPYNTQPLHFLLSPKKRAENRPERYSPSETDRLLGEWEGLWSGKLDKQGKKWKLLPWAVRHCPELVVLNVLMEVKQARTVLLYNGPAPLEEAIVEATQRRNYSKESSAQWSREFWCFKNSEVEMMTQLFNIWLKYLLNNIIPWPVTSCSDLLNMLFYISLFCSSIFP